MIGDWFENPWTRILSGLLLTGIVIQAAYRKQIETVDTYIPLGHVLVPIEVKDPHKIRHFAGNQFKADIYARSKLVLTKAQVVRAPKNPDVYAVMLPDKKADQLVLAHGPFEIRMHNPKNPPRVVVPRISYGPNP